MSTVFEEFLRNFYRKELAGYSVGSEIMSWDAECSNPSDLSFLPAMKTDVTLRTDGRTVVLDAKYYKEILAGSLYAPRLRSGHLYQLSIYLAHARKRETGRLLKGMLIYPSSGQHLRLSYKLLGVDILVATVNLNEKWQLIHEELLNIILNMQET